MSKFKMHLILFFASLIILINVDWISARLNTPLAIHPVLKSASLVVLISEIWIPHLQRFSLPLSTLLWTGIYLVLRLLILPQPVLSLIEVIFWGCLVVFAHLAASSIDEVNDAIRVAAGEGQSAPAIDLAEAQDLVRAELTRSRHYNRPFSLIAVKCSNGMVDKSLEKVVAEIRSSLVQKYLKTRLARTLRDEIRAMDLILDDRTSGNLLLLCPEIDAQNAEIMINHLSLAIERDYGFNAVMASASFPDASPTFDGLVELINQRLLEEPAVTNLSRELIKSGSQYSK